MLILTRYIQSEIFKIFAVSLSGMTLLLTLGMGVREGLSAGLPPLLIFRLMPYLLPEILGITIPVAVLFAVSQVFGRMSGSNEITAVKAAGISPLVVVWPAIVFAFFVSLFTVWMYDLAATWGNPGVKRVVMESVEEIAYGMLRKNRAYASSQFSIAVKDVEGRKLIRPTITINGRDGTPTVTFSAEQAELWADKRAGALTIVCHKGMVEVGNGQSRYQFPDTVRQVIPFEDTQRPIHREWLGMAEIHRCLEYLRSQVAQVEASLEGDERDPQELAQRQKKLAELWRKIHRIRTEPYRRWANGFSSLCFVIIGGPIAIYWRNENFLAIFFLCFLPVLAIYYPLLMLADGLTGAGVLHPVGFWVANLGVLIPGLVLMHRLSQS